MDRSFEQSREGTGHAWSRDRLVWAGALLFYGVGDTVTTIVGLRVDGVAEIGPIAGPAMLAFGPAGLLGVKVVLFLVLGALWHVLETPGRVAIPLGIATVGAVVTIWNTFVISTAF